MRFIFLLLSKQKQQFAISRNDDALARSVCLSGGTREHNNDIETRAFFARLSKDAAAIENRFCHFTLPNAKCHQACSVGGQSRQKRAQILNRPACFASAAFFRHPSVPCFRVFTDFDLNPSQLPGAAFTMDTNPPLPYKAKYFSLAATEDHGASLKAYVAAVLDNPKVDEKEKSELVRLETSVVNILRENNSNDQPIPVALDSSKGSTNSVEVDASASLFDRVGDTCDNNLQTCPICKDYQADPLDGELYEDDGEDDRVEDKTPVTDVRKYIQEECEMVKNIHSMEYTKRYKLVHEVVKDGPYRFHFVCMSEEKRKNLTEALVEQPHIGRVVNTLGETSMFIYDPAEAKNISKPDQFKLILAAMVGRLIRPIHFLEESLQKKKLLKAHELCEVLRPPTDFMHMVEAVSVYTLSIINTGEYQFPMCGRNIVMCMPSHTNRFIYDFLLLQGASVCYIKPDEFIKNNTIHMLIYDDMEQLPFGPLLRRLQTNEFKQFIANNCKKYYVTNRLYPGGAQERLKLRNIRIRDFNLDKQAMIAKELADQFVETESLADENKPCQSKKKGKHAGKSNRK
uniref:ANK_REP_REGION domain-containing protein n=1 Tax=Panagrellus redivivus TaxID=6233 RepID=A0A7E4V6I9_PANRE